MSKKRRDKDYNNSKEEDLSKISENSLELSQVVQ